MRFTRKVCLSVLTAAMALGAAPALAAAAPPPDPQFPGIEPCRPGFVQVWVDRPGTRPRIEIDKWGNFTLIPAEPPFHGYECQPYVLRPHV
jgi:hypothetical protein